MKNRKKVLVAAILFCFVGIGLKCVDWFVLPDIKEEGVSIVLKEGEQEGAEAVAKKISQRNITKLIISSVGTGSIAFGLVAGMTLLMNRETKNSQTKKK